MSPEDEHHRIVATYAAGHDIADIEQRYGVTQDEVEWLVAQDKRRPPTPSAPTNRAAASGPPAPVATAAVSIAAAALMPLGVLIVGILAGAGGLIIPLAMVVFVGITICAPTAYGLWQGRRGSRVVTIVVGGMVVVYGLSTLGTGVLGLLGMVIGAGSIALVVVPRSSRDWFASRP